MRNTRGLEGNAPPKWIVAHDGNDRFLRAEHAFPPSRSIGVPNPSLRHRPFALQATATKLRLKHPQQSQGRTRSLGTILL
jgi:hypothetical protein